MFCSHHSLLFVLSFPGWHQAEPCRAGCSSSPQASSRAACLPSPQLCSSMHYLAGLAEFIEWLGLEGTPVIIKFQLPDDLIQSCWVLSNGPGQGDTQADCGLTPRMVPVKIMEDLLSLSTMVLRSTEAAITNKMGSPVEASPELVQHTSLVSKSVEMQ